MEVKYDVTIRARFGRQNKKPPVWVVSFWLPELGEREKTIKYRFFEVKSTKQGVTGVSIRATHNDYAA